MWGQLCIQSSTQLQAGSQIGSEAPKMALGFSSLLGFPKAFPRTNSLGAGRTFPEAASSGC